MSVSVSVSMSASECERECERVGRPHVSVRMCPSVWLLPFHPLGLLFTATHLWQGDPATAVAQISPCWNKQVPAYG